MVIPNLYNKCGGFFLFLHKTVREETDKAFPGTDIKIFAALFLLHLSYFYTKQVVRKLIRHFQELTSKHLQQFQHGRSAVKTVEIILNVNFGRTTIQRLDHQ